MKRAEVTQIFEIKVKTRTDAFGNFDYTIFCADADLDNNNPKSNQRAIIFTNSSEIVDELRTGGLLI
jgi:hypothetical protein